MDFKIIYYDLTQQKQSEIENALETFKIELVKYIPKFKHLKIVSGNQSFPDILKSMHSIAVSFTGTGPLSENCLISAIMNKIENFDYTTRTIIVLPTSNIVFRNFPGAHGVCMGEKFVVLSRVYRNIIWHETAHLFGAEDHYQKQKPTFMKDICTEKEVCVMQWDPGNKDVIFCTRSIQEMTDYLR